MKHLLCRFEFEKINTFQRYQLILQLIFTLSFLFLKCYLLRVRKKLNLTRVHLTRVKFKK